MKHNWNNIIKEKAKKLRQKGLSYGQLVCELGVPRSTLHQWVHNYKRPIRFTKLDRIRWIKKIQPLGAQGNKQKRERKLKQIIKKVQKETDSIPIDKTVSKMLLAMLYWAEGTKTGGTLQFVNIDPKLMLLFITLLRKCYHINEKKLRVRLHLHYYHRIKKVRKYWSNLLKIPEEQFNKSYRKKRSKEKNFRRNFGGICFLRYNNTYLKEEILQFAYSVAKKMSSHFAPIA